MIAANKTEQDKITPQAALKLLQEGNQRFLAEQPNNKPYQPQIDGTSAGQYPYACVLGCIDSRVPAEMVFDTGIGDIFNVRIAGNFSNTDILGSMEFACKVAGAKVILVLGHTQCGAVKGACDHVELGNLTAMLQNLEDVVSSTAYTGDRSSANLEFVDLVAKNNVHATIEKIKTESPILAEMEANGELLILGGMYDVTTGSVLFYE
jgi:carbonic anhydrase